MHAHSLVLIRQPRRARRQRVRHGETEPWGCLAQCALELGGAGHVGGRCGRRHVELQAHTHRPPRAVDASGAAVRNAWWGDSERLAYDRRAGWERGRGVVRR